MDPLIDLDPRLRKPSSIVEVLRWRATNQPHETGYVYLKEGRVPEQRVTYSDLDLSARRIALALRGPANPGDRALLFYPSGRDFLAAFFGCLYAGVVAIPLYPPRANRSLSRLESIIKDSGARLALTQTARADQLTAHLGSLISPDAITVVTTDALEMSSAQFDGPDPASGDVAYLQYTSGSTSVPKGVMVTHGGLAYNCAYMIDSYGLTAEDTSVTWLPHFHDMGLIEGLLDPLYLGTQVAVISPAQFAQRPLSWLKAISDLGASHSGAPNFAFDLCVSKIKPEQRDELDLSCWESAYCGAEPVRAATMDRFAEYFGPAGFRKSALYPCYGLAEATLMVSGSTRTHPPKVMPADAALLEQGVAVPASPGTSSRAVVGCGHARGEMQVLIVDPHTLIECSDGTVGEIWVGGPTLPAGYWQNEQATDETFRSHTSDGRGPFMRTGDLGFLIDAELYIASRLKDLVIIRGANFYPQDIEWVVETAHPALRPGRGAAFSVEVGDQERLVIAQEIERSHRRDGPNELQAVADAIRQVIAGEFDLEVYCVRLLDAGAAPMTSSGKIQRQACRDSFLSGDRSQVLWESRLAPSTGGSQPIRLLPLRRADLAGMHPGERRRALLGYLTQQVAAVLGISVDEIRPDQPLGSLGLDSLNGNELTSALEKALELKLSATMVWNYPTVEQISNHIAEQLFPGEMDNGPQLHRGAVG